MATKTILKKYINQLNKNPYNMSDIQFDKLIVVECLELVKVSGICLKNIPVVKRTKKVCVAAVDNNPLALEYVPKRFKTLEMCEIAYKKNEEVFPYLLPEMHTLELGIDCYQRLLSQKDISDSLVAISKALPKEFHENKRIISLERNLEIRKIVSKQYKNGRFIVVEEVIYQQEKLENYFEKFEEFYDFVDRDLKDA